MFKRLYDVYANRQYQNRLSGDSSLVFVKKSGSYMYGIAQFTAKMKINENSFYFHRHFEYSLHNGFVM